MARRAEPMRDRRHSHSDLITPTNRQQRFRPTSEDTRKVFTQKTGRLISKEYRGAVGRMCRNRAGWTDFDAVIASSTTLQEELFGHSTRRTQPIPTHRWWRRRDGKSFCLLDQFLCRFDGREYRILQKRSPAVCGVGSHDKGHVLCSGSRVSCFWLENPKLETGNGKRRQRYITPSARSLYTSTQRSQAPNSISHPG